MVDVTILPCKFQFTDGSMYSGQVLVEHWKLGLVVAFCSYILLNTLWTALRSGLRGIPGPFAARFTRLYLFRQATKGNGHTLYYDLHQRYGKLVRVGPEKVSISDADAIPLIYNISSKYRKVFTILISLNRLLLIYV